MAELPTFIRFSLLSLNSHLSPHLLNIRRLKIIPNISIHPSIHPLPETTWAFSDSDQWTSQVEPTMLASICFSDSDSDFDPDLGRMIDLASTYPSVSVTVSSQVASLKKGEARPQTRPDHSLTRPKIGRSTDQYTKVL